jgi:hypothetical protein
MRTLGIGIAAAITLAAAGVPANAQGLWIGAPGLGIGVGPTPYYSRDWGGPYWGAGYGYYGYEPSDAYQSYAYEPEYSYDSYAYVPDEGYVAYSYGPRLRTYAYDLVDSYGYAPRVRYSRNFSYSAGVRATRSYSYADTRGVIRDRGHRSTMIHSTRLQDRAVTRNSFAVGAERENAGSRRIRPEASRALARGPAQDLRQSKSIEAGKTGKSRVRSQTY